MRADHVLCAPCYYDWDRPRLPDPPSGSVWCSTGTVVSGWDEASGSLAWFACAHVPDPRDPDVAHWLDQLRGRRDDVTLRGVYADWVQERYPEGAYLRCVRRQLRVPYSPTLELDFLLYRMDQYGARGPERPIESFIFQGPAPI